MEPLEHPDEQNCHVLESVRERRRLPAHFILVLEAYRDLVRFDLCIARGHFESIYNRVRNCPIRKQLAACDPTETICSAIDTACIWYRKEVLCLQRSVVTTCLLRKYGVPAQMVIGAQQVPFKAHAWVEVGQRVVNDKPYVVEMYGILSRC